MQRNKNGIVVDVRSQRLKRTTSLLKDYEMISLDFIEICKNEIHIIMPTTDIELGNYLASGYKVLSRFRENVAVPKVMKLI